MSLNKDYLLSEEQLRHFHEEGYLIVPKFFEKNELQSVMDSICELVDDLARELYRDGRITDLAESEGFYTRLTRLEQQFPGAAVLLHKRGVLPEAFATLWSNPRLLDVIEQILGPEVAGHPVWNLRTKTPNNPSVTVPWHQDTAYLSPGSEHTLQPTAWIPLIDANQENGCMQVYAKGHQKKIVVQHECCAGPSWYISIPEERLKETLGESEIVTCEVPLGGFLLLNQLLPHQSMENKSNKIRWSLDLRWQRPDEPHGFFGAKVPILMRTAKDPSYTIDWSEWSKQDRNVLWDKEAAKSLIITGPWMARWPITHSNKHSEHFRATDPKSWGKS